MQRIANQTIVGQTVSFTGGDVLMVGPGLRLIDCEVIVSIRGRDLSCSNVAFERCHIAARRVLKDVMWGNVEFMHCSFDGVFRDINFGFATPARYRCAVAGCDFRNAVLDGCSFLGCEIQDNQFGHWPTVLVAAPAKLRDFARTLSWPGTLADYWLPEFSPDLQFQADWAPNICKEFGVTEDDIRESFRRIPGMHDL